MAHGTGRLNICIPCQRYIYVNRFSANEVCPICLETASNTTKEEIKSLYFLPFMFEIGCPTSWRSLSTFEKR